MPRFQRRLKRDVRGGLTFGDLMVFGAYYTDENPNVVILTCGDDSFLFAIPKSIFEAVTRGDMSDGVMLDEVWYFGNLAEWRLEKIKSDSITYGGFVIDFSTVSKFAPDITVIRIADGRRFALPTSVFVKVESGNVGDFAMVPVRILF